MSRIVIGGLTAVRRELPDRWVLPLMFTNGADHRWVVDVETTGLSVAKACLVLPDALGGREEHEVVFDALLWLGVQAVEEHLKERRPLPAPHEPRIRFVFDESALAGFFKAGGAKQCSEQQRGSRGLECIAGARELDDSAQQNLDRPLRLEARLRVLPTTETTCASCSMPDARVVCAHLRWPEVRLKPTGNVGSPVFKRRLIRAECERDLDPVKHRPASCRVGGARCWERIVEVVEATSPEASPLQRYGEFTKLGDGANASVWRATDSLLRRTVAVKIITASAPSHLDALGHARALTRAGEHPNVVVVYDVTRLLHPVLRDVVDAVIMELVEGPRLAERLDFKFEVEEARTVGIELLAAVGHYHAGGLAHGDLHSEQIILGPRGVKVLDPLYYATEIAASTTRGPEMLQHDLRRLRDLLQKLVEKADMPPEQSLGLVRLTGRISLDDLRRTFLEALSGSQRTAAVPPSQPRAAAQQHRGARRGRVMAAVIGMCDQELEGCTAMATAEPGAVLVLQIDGATNQVHACQTCLDTLVSQGSLSLTA